MKTKNNLNTLSLVGLTAAVAMIGLGAYQPNRFTDSLPKQQKVDSQSTVHVPIESLVVGERVLTGTDADLNSATQVDPSTWKKIAIEAEWIWPDGTVDLFQIETLQGPEWLVANAASPGQIVPLPLDVHEMGCPADLHGRIVSLGPCPDIETKPGKVVLTTVNHLNPRCRELVVVDAQGLIDRIQTTDFHPFWSEAKQGWAQAYTLSIGDRLRGLKGEILSVQSSERIDGVHSVYNLTVEDEHVYRVGHFNALVHNNDCFDDAIEFQAKHGGGILNVHGEGTRIPGRTSPIPTPPGHSPDSPDFFDHAVNIVDGRVYDRHLPDDGLDVDDWIEVLSNSQPDRPFHIDPWYPGGPRHAHR